MDTAELEFLVSLKDQATSALQALQGVLKDVTGPLPDITAGIDVDPSGAASAVDEAADAADSLAPAFEAAGEAAGDDLASSVTDGVDDLPGDLADVGTQGGSGLSDAAEAAAAGIALDEVVTDATSGIPDLFEEQGTDAGQEFAEGVSDEVEDGSAKWSVVAVAGITAAVAGVVAAAKGLYDVGSTFDDVNDTIQITTGKSGTALDGMSQIVDNIAKTTPAGFDTISQAVAQLAQRTGMTGEPLQKLATQFVQLGNLGQQVDVNTVTGALAAFNVPAGQASKTLDTLFDISQATGVGVNDLAGSVASGAAAFKPYGLSITDSASLLGTLDKAGIDSGSTTAALTRGLANFAAAGKEPRAALQDVIDKIKGYTDAGQTAKAIDVAGGIFGTRGAAAFVNAVSTGKVQLDDLLKSTGATSQGIVQLAQDTADAPESFEVLKNQATLALKPLGDEVWNVAGALGAAAVGQLPQFVSALQTGGRDARAFGADLADAGKWVQDNRGKIEVIAGVITALLLPALAAAGVNATVAAAKQVAAWVVSGAASIAGSATSVAGLYAQAAGWVTSGASAVAGAAVQVGAWIAAGAGAVATAATYALSFGAMLLGWAAQGAAAVAAAAVVVGGWIAMGAAALAEAAVMAAAWLISIGPIVLVIAAVVALTALIITHWSQIVDATQAAWSAVAGFVSAAWDAVVAFVVAAAEHVWSAVQSAWSSVTSATSSAWESVKSATSSAWDAVTGFLSSALGVMVSLVERFTLPGLIIAHWGAITSATSTAWAAVTGAVSAAIAAVVATASQIASFIGTVLGYFTALPGQITSGLASIASTVASVGSNAVAGIVGGITGAWGTLTSAAGQVPGKITGALKDIASDVKSIGTNIIEGIKDGVQDAAASLASTVANAAKSALNAAKSALGIHSPSTVFRDEVGAMLGAGWQEGIEASGADVVAAAEQIARDAVTAASTGQVSVGGGATASPTVGDVTAASERSSTADIVAVGQSGSDGPMTFVIVDQDGAVQLAMTATAADAVTAASATSVVLERQQGRGRS